MNIIFAYLLTLPLVAALDLIWLGFVMRDFYQTRLGHLLSPTINWPVAVIFYLTFALGIFYLASHPAFEQQSLLRAIGMGALLGIFAYATYDLTNMATLTNWPLSVTIVDILWGAVISGAVAGAGYLFLQLLVR